MARSISSPPTTPTCPPSCARDVVFLSLPPARPDGTFGFGLGADYVATFVGSARVVIAEVNDQVPDLSCDRRLSPDQIDVVVAGVAAAGRSIRPRRRATSRTRSRLTSPA